MPFCIPTHLINAFLQAVKDGIIDPIKMMDMSSEARRELLAPFVGSEENARKVNVLYESKLLLKDQQRGMITWIKNTAGLSGKRQTDMISRVNKLEKALTPDSENAFLEDLVAQKLGVTVTMEEAANISELARIATEKKEIMEASDSRRILPFGKETEVEMTYGRAAIGFRNYLSELKSGEQVTLVGAKKDPIGTISRLLFEVANDPTGSFFVAAGISKSLKATLDLSALLRQGWKVIWTNPEVWRRQALGTFQDAYASLQGKNVMDEINASAVSGPNYKNMMKDNLAISVIEEEFPQSELLEQIPFFGQLHKASDDAFTGFAYKNRIDLYNYYTFVAKQSGITETTGIGIGELVNSITSRGKLGRLEPIADILNVMFFSLRNLKSNLDVLTFHLLSKKVRQNKFVRKQAAISTLRIISGTAAVLAIASAMGADVEKDPRSADFGKIKVGNTRFDVSGGMASIVVLAMRLITGSVKSSTTGKITDIRGKDFSIRTADDVVYDFFANKLAPAASVARNLLRGKTFEGDTPTVLNTIEDLAVPISIETFFELMKDPDSADIVLSMIAESLGIGTQTYSGTKKAVGIGK